MSATLPTEQGEETPRITSRSFTHGGQTWVYNPDLITMEQAIIADEALQFKLELMQREAETFTQVVEAGGAEWFTKCAGALLVRMEVDTPVPYSPAQWIAACRHVATMPYAQMAALRECVEDFFTSIGRKSAFSFAFSGRSKMMSNPLVLSLLRTATKQSASDTR